MRFFNWTIKIHKNIDSFVFTFRSFRNYNVGGKSWWLLNLRWYTITVEPW